MRKIYTLVSIFLITGCLVFYFFHKGGPIFHRESRGEREELGGEDHDDGPLASMKQEVLMTKDPRLGYVPTERLLQYKAFKMNAGRKTILGSGSGVTPQTLSSGLAWIERGPNNIGGRCRGILVDQSDPTGNTVLAGSVSGGLWRTTNFTAATPLWTQNSTVLANLAITTLAQDPTNRSTMYAGTGEGYFNIDAIRGLGIYKSVDGGLTWALLPSTTSGGANQNDFNYVQKVAVYSNGDLYASGISAVYCNEGGVLRSTNQGSTWTRVIGTYGGGGCGTAVDFFGYDIEFSLAGDIYASVQDVSTGFFNGKIYKSPAGATVGNAGTWTNITPPPAGNWQRIQLAASASTNERIYALAQGTGNSIGGIRRSDDGGTTWTNINNNTTWCDGGSSNGKDFSRGQAWYDLTLAVNPSNDAVVYAGGVDIMHTTNSGAAWSQTTQWASGCGTLPYIHADIHNIVFLPGSSTSFIVGCDGGIFYTADGGNTFVSKDAGLNVTQYYAAAIHPASGSNHMLAGAQDNGSHIFNNPGINAVTYASGGDGMFCFIDQQNPTDQISSYTNANYYVSTNGGTSFSASPAFSSSDGRFINPADYDNSLKRLYCGSIPAKLKRIDNIFGAPTATDILVTANNELQVSAVKADPTTSDNVWVAFSTADTASNSQAPALYLITGASTGSPVATQVGAASLVLPAGSYINSIDVEQGNSAHLVIAASNYGIASVWESTDHGATWTSLDNNGVNLPDMPVYWAMIVPSTANVNTGGANGGILLATEMGVWSTSVSAGTGTVWTENSATMGNVSTRMLQYRASDLQVVAATHGRGLFTTSISAIPLPLIFTSFTGAVTGMSNSLDWNVADELNNKGFAVERSYGASSGFTQIGFVPATSPDFHASDHYTFVDGSIDLGAPAASYRLGQTDLDGKLTYSDIITIRRTASDKMVQYMSVAGNTLFLRMNGSSSSPVSVRILDMAGRLVATRAISFGTQSLDVGYLARGMYVLNLISADRGQFSGKFEKP